MPENKYEVLRLKGAETESVFDALAALRITVFREYPYLYEGDTAYEKDYLRVYSDSARSFLAALYYHGVLVGATTCLPLLDETETLQAPFRKHGFDPATFFYFGESIILPSHRGHGFGHLFFDVREAHAQSFGTYTHTCFCSVDRGNAHPCKPVQYRSNEAFWLKRGYQKMPAVRAEMEWPDVGESSPTTKPMIFWIREIPRSF